MSNDGYEHTYIAVKTGQAFWADPLALYFCVGRTIKKT